MLPFIRRYAPGACSNHSIRYLHRGQHTDTGSIGCCEPQVTSKWLGGAPYTCIAAGGDIRQQLIPLPPVRGSWVLDW